MSNDESKTGTFEGIGTRRFMGRRSGAERTEIDPVPMEQNALLVKVFERVRRGYELDRVLIDSALSKKLVVAAHKAGVRGDAEAINRRLQAIRKNSKYYGIKFKKFSRSADLDPQPYLVAAELAYVRLRCARYSSVDEILLDPQMGEEFVAYCKDIEPGGGAAEFKWAALVLRKLRHFTPEKKRRLMRIGPERIEAGMRLAGTLDSLNVEELPAEGGLYSFIERSPRPRYLFVGAGENLGEAIAPLVRAEPLRSAGGGKWQPVLNDIALHLAVVEKSDSRPSARELSFRLIERRRPLFNMPVHLDRFGL